MSGFDYRAPGASSGGGGSITVQGQGGTPTVTDVKVIRMEGVRVIDGSGGLAVATTPAKLFSAVPIMTSDTAPSGVCSASSYHVTVPPWKAFIGPSGGWFNNGEGLPVWLQYQFPAAVVIQGYSILPWSLDSWDGRCITAWHLDASNDGSSWTTLHTVSHSWPWVQWVKEVFGFYNVTPYAYYRLVITATKGNSYTGLQSFELFE